MFSAHLVFGDIDGHSEKDFPSRVKQLESFWELCKRHRPQELLEQPDSFYDADNDSIMAGFSGVRRPFRGITILKWVLTFQEALEKSGIPVTFGVNLVACKEQIRWDTYPGFRNRPDMLHIADSTYEECGHIRRDRLVGDALIVVSRLLQLAKRIHIPVAFSTFQGGHLDQFRTIENDLGSGGRIHVSEITPQFNQLPPNYARWLEKHEVRAWGIERDRAFPGTARDREEVRIP